MAKKTEPRVEEKHAVEEVPAPAPAPATVTMAPRGVQTRGTFTRSWFNHQRYVMKLLKAMHG